MSDHKHSPVPASPEAQDANAHALTAALESSFLIVKIAMGALLVIILGSGIFTVGPQEKAIILRFGRPVGEGPSMLLGAGLHWAWPQPIDEVVKIPISEIQKVTSSVGWYATTPEMELAGTEPPAGPSLNPAIDGYVITADRNIIHSRATVSYHIDDPRAAIFNFAAGTNHSFDLAGISNAVVNAANNALVATAARFNVDDILTGKVGEFKDAVEHQVNQLVDAAHLGVVVDQCLVQSAAPRQLKEVFAQVTAARQNREKLLNDAAGEASRITNNAVAQAFAIVNAAETERNNYVQSVRSEAAAFEQLKPKYESNPRLYAELELARTMSVVLTNVQDKIFLPQRADGKPRELRLQLNREPVQNRSGQ
ncbi:MAG TPA: protease modulator HflK [Verrucomicrobiae bacterium]